MNKVGIIILCAFIAFCSCKKDKKETGVTFNNHLDKQVTLTVYPSMDDYANGTNPVVRKTVKASDILTLQSTTFVTGRTYYMDWYTDDLYTNNWFNDTYPVAGSQVAFKVGNGGSSSYYFEPGFTGYGRKTFLSNNDLSSNWHAIDAYMFSPSTGYTSFWSSMSENDRYKQIKVYKGFIADYNYKNGVGNIITESLKFKVQRSEEAYIEFIDSVGHVQGSLATGVLPTGKAPDYKSSSKDTILAFLPNSDYYFMMIKD